MEDKKIADFNELFTKEEILADLKEKEKNAQKLELEAKRELEDLTEERV